MRRTRSVKKACIYTEKSSSEDDGEPKKKSPCFESSDSNDAFAMGVSKKINKQSSDSNDTLDKSVSKKIIRLNESKKRTCSKSSDDEEIISPGKKKVAHIEPSDDEDKGDSSSSESDIETYLKRPDELNLNSNFFKTVQPKVAFTQIEKNIFENVTQLSDSESDIEEEKEEETKKKAANSKSANETPRATFAQLSEFTRRLEEAKMHVEKYEARKTLTEKKVDIGKLLTMGEKAACDSPEMLKKDHSAFADKSLRSSEFESFSDSEKEDWEEVEQSEQPPKTNAIPKDGVEITVRMPDTIRKKKGVDLVAAMKRRLNKFKKENQLYVHRVHLLCWIAHGNYVNNVLNTESVLALALSLLPSQQCYPSDRTDLKYLEQILAWYRRTVTNVEKITPKNIPLDKNLIMQINKKQAHNSKMYVYIFICILRALGIQCRLVLSLQVEPLRPPASDLHSLSSKKESGDNKASSSGIQKEKKASTTPDKKSNVKKSTANKSKNDTLEEVVVHKQQPVRKRKTVVEKEPIASKKLKAKPTGKLNEKTKDKRECSVDKNTNKNSNYSDKLCDSIETRSNKRSRQRQNANKKSEDEEVKSADKSLEKIDIEEIRNIIGVRKKTVSISNNGVNNDEAKSPKNKKQTEKDGAENKSKAITNKSSKKKEVGKDTLDDKLDSSECKDVKTINKDNQSNKKSTTTSKKTTPVRKIHEKNIKQTSNSKSKKALLKDNHEDAIIYEKTDVIQDKHENQVQRPTRKNKNVNEEKEKILIRKTNDSKESLDVVKDGNDAKSDGDVTNELNTGALLCKNSKANDNLKVVSKKNTRSRKPVSKIEKKLDDYIATLENLEKVELDNNAGNSKTSPQSSKTTLQVPTIIDNLEMDRDQWRRSKSHSPHGSKSKTETAPVLEKSVSTCDVGEIPEESGKKAVLTRGRKKKTTGVFRMPLKRKTKSSEIPQMDGIIDSSDESISSSDYSMLEIPQLDGNDDGPSTSKKPSLNKLKEEKPVTKKLPARLKIQPIYREVDSEDDFSPRSPFTSKNHDYSKVNLGKLADPNISTQKLNKSSPKVNLHKLSQTPKASKPLDVRNDIVSLVKGRMREQKHKDKTKLVKSKVVDNDSDSDYAPMPVIKKKQSEDNKLIKKVKVKRRVAPKSELDRKVFSSDEEGSSEATKKKKGIDIWIEVYLENEEKWISADVVKGQVHCVKEIYSRASHPVSYILAWDNINRVKDITKRYCLNWNTVTRKLRTDQKWWEQSLAPFVGKKNARDKEEDEDLARQQLDQPLPKTISEFKDHPLYVLRRHLLKFQAIYPPDAITLGFVRNEPVYSRDCVYTLHSREIWLKHAKVVKPGEKPYKIVKARPKYDKLSNTLIKDQLLEIFGEWQIEDYVPPTAENGIVPRNAYGNVELFKECMLPKGTVHLQLPGLNKVARKLNVDCAPAVTGFDFHSGWSHPTFDGFIVCEEFADKLVAAWYQEQEEIEKREQEKYEKRVYGNWKRLIKGLFIRERLKARYDFGGELTVPIPKPPEKPETKPKGPRFIINKMKKK